MLSEESHLSDQELLLAADGELSARDAGRVQSHLAACWTCRTRQQEMEASIGEFVRSYRRNFEGYIPPADGPRALLKAQLAQLAETPADALETLLGRCRRRVRIGCHNLLCSSTPGRGDQPHTWWT